MWLFRITHNETICDRKATSVLSMISKLWEDRRKILLILYHRFFFSIGVLIEGAKRPIRFPPNKTTTLRIKISTHFSMFTDVVFLDFKQYKKRKSDLLSATVHKAICSPIQIWTCRLLCYLMAISVRHHSWTAERPSSSL